jgi:hypothetical protein
MVNLQFLMNIGAVKLFMFHTLNHISIPGEDYGDAMTLYT